MMEEYVDKVVHIVTNDGRNIIGVLKGFDQTTNVVLDECHERVFSTSAGVEQVACAMTPARDHCLSGTPQPVFQVVLGLYIIRGDNMCAAQLNSRNLVQHEMCCPTVRSALVGDVDEKADAELDLSEIFAEPLKPVVH